MRLIIPSELFLNGTLFAQMAIMGNVDYNKKNNTNGRMVEPHVDSGDIYTVYLTLGRFGSGGGSFFFGIDDNSIPETVDFGNFNIFMGQMDSIKHGAYAWMGQRIILFQGDVNFFRKKGSAEIYAKYKDLKYLRKNSWLLNILQTQIVYLTMFVISTLTLRNTRYYDICKQN